MIFRWTFLINRKKWNVNLYLILVNAADPSLSRGKFCNREKLEFWYTRVGRKLCSLDLGPQKEI